MTFIKIQNVVINTSYVAGVKLNNSIFSGDKSVSVPLATPQFSSFQWDTIAKNLYYYKWIQFTGQAAITLQDYFSSFNNVIDRANFGFWTSAWHFDNAQCGDAQSFSTRRCANDKAQEPSNAFGFFGLSYTHCGWNKSKRRLSLRLITH